MRLRLSIFALAAFSAAPALAHGSYHSAADAAAAAAGDAAVAAADADGRVFGHDLPPQPDDRMAQWQDDRAAWLDECRDRMDDRGSRRSDYRRSGSSGITGGVLGGVAGGLLGRGIAGRHDRTLGTVAGAAVGAVAGAAIERASSNRSSRSNDRRYDERGGDYCEQYFNYYTQGAWNQQGMVHGQAMMMVPVMQMQAHNHGRNCVETVVTEEYVTVRQPRRVRYIRVPDKRVRIVPDKRLPMK